MKKTEALAKKILESIKITGATYEATENYNQYRKTMVDFEINDLHWILREIESLKKGNPGRIYEMKAAIKTPSTEVQKALKFLLVSLPKKSEEDIQKAIGLLIGLTKSTIEKQQN